MTEGLVGKTVKVCHKKGQVVSEHDRSYKVSMELGGVNQHVVVSKDYAASNLVDE